LEAVHDAEKTGRPLQILSIDLKTAFDTITPQAIFKTMQLQKFPGIYVESLKRKQAREEYMLMIYLAYYET
jgi:hypothetical protein